MESFPGKEEIEVLAKMPWRKLIVSNGVAGLVGAIILVSYFRTSIFSKEEGVALQTQVQTIDKKMNQLIIHLIPIPNVTPGADQSRSRSNKSNTAMPARPKIEGPSALANVLRE